MGGGVGLPRQKDSYTVLITGLGPFPNGRGGHYEENDNTSHLITQHLPPVLSPTHALNPTNLPIHILNPTAPPGKHMRSEYAWIRRYIDQLWDEHGRKVDLFLHLGMADGWDVYTVEERAYKEGFSSTFWDASAREEYYLVEDDAGRNIRDIKPEEGKGKWKDLSMGLGSILEIEDVVRTAQTGVEKQLNRALEDGVKDVVVQAHHEAGSYTCGFTYYESLAQAYSRKSDVKVVFTHVPGWKDERSLERGAAAVCAIAGAICAQIVK